MAAAKGWARGQCCGRTVYTVRTEAEAELKEWKAMYPDTVRARLFQRVVKAGRCSVDVWMVVARRTVPEGGQ